MGIIWITGLANSGKTFLANKINQRLQKKFINTIIIDGDIMRSFLNLKNDHYEPHKRKNLAFFYSKLSKYLSDQGFLVITSTISMFQEVRDWNRKNNDKYFEIYIKISKKERLSRDKDMIYKNQQTVEFNEFYEEPENPNLVINEDINLEYLLKKISEYFNIL